MADLVINQRQLWLFIVRMLWVSAATYAAALVLAFASDFLRSFAPRAAGRSFVIPRPLRLWLQPYAQARSFTPAVYDVLRVLANITICTAYVVATYRRNVIFPIAVINRVFASLFTLDIVLNALAKPSAVLYFWNFRQFLSVWSLPSLFSARGPSQFLHFGFLRAYDAFYSYLDIERTVVPSRSDHKKKLALRLGLHFLTLFFVLANGIQMLEIPGDWLNSRFQEQWAVLNDWHFFNCFYYVIVTLSTVGYGDFSPRTLQGRVYTILMIIIGILVFTKIVDELQNDTQRQRGIGTFRPTRDRRHVIVSGNPTLDEFQHFLVAFYDGDTSYLNKQSMIVLLLENPRFSDDEWYTQIASNSFTQAHIVYLVGSVQEPADLERAGIHSASAVFILTSPTGDGGNEKLGSSDSTRRVQQADTQAVMTALAVRNVRTDIPIFAKTLLDDSNDQIQFALSTPATGFGDEELRFRPSAGIPGRYRSFLETVATEERNALPRSWRPKERPNWDKLDDEHVAEIDAKHSTHVCMQQLYTALMVANMKANGVGTLVTNLHIEFADERESKDYSNHENTPWLIEYAMGSECSLLNAVIPDELHNVRVRDIAVLLYKSGMLVVGSRFDDATKDLSIDLALNMDLQLKAGEVCMFLTYLDMSHLAVALRIVAEEFLEFKKKDERPQICADFKEKHEGEAVDYGPGGKVQYLQGPMNKPDAGRPGRRDSTTISASQRFDFDTGGRMLRESPSIRGKIDAFTQRHIIIALEGRTPLDNLEYFLDLLNPIGLGEPVPVVIICSAPTAVDRQRYEARKAVFLLDGKPSSRASWHEAKLSNARAVAILADYTQRRSADASTIYTLLTLDAVLDPGQNIFVCSELMDEQSIELLRQPNFPRRYGLPLGQPNGMTVVRTLGADNDAARAPEEDGESDAADNADVPGEETDELVLPSPVEVTPAPVRLPTRPHHVGVQPEPSRVSSKLRDYLFSRYRYTSGELLVHSTADSLLVREYAEPGFIGFVRKLVGAAGQGQNIRLVRVPQTLFEEYSGELQYGIVFERLVALGVTPLGLYRSGAAEVRYPTHKRIARGQHMWDAAAARDAVWGACLPNLGDLGSHLPYRQQTQMARENLLQRRQPQGATQRRLRWCLGGRPEFNPEAYETKSQAQNMLPYVYSLPEPYTSVDINDGVYVLCHPTLILPEDWPRPTA